MSTIVPLQMLQQAAFDLNAAGHPSHHPYVEVRCTMGRAPYLRGEPQRLPTESSTGPSTASRGSARTPARSPAHRSIWAAYFSIRVAGPCRQRCGSRRSNPRGARSRGSWPITSCRMLVPVRPIPVMKIGDSIGCSRISGCRSLGSREAQQCRQFPHQVQACQYPAGEVQVRFGGDVGDQVAERFAPGLIGAEVVQAGRGPGGVEQ